MLADNVYPVGMDKSPQRKRFERWKTAFSRASEKAGEIIGHDPTTSQSKISRRMDDLLGEHVAQRTIGRFANGATDTKASTLFMLFAVVPEVESAFLEALQDKPVDDAEAAAWGRIGRRMAAIMPADAGLRLVDALEDLAALGGLDTSFPELRLSAQKIRHGRAAERADRRKPEPSQGPGSAAGNET